MLKSIETLAYKLLVREGDQVVETDAQMFLKPDNLAPVCKVWVTVERDGAREERASVFTYNGSQWVEIL